MQTARESVIKLVNFIAIFNKISPYFVQYQTSWCCCLSLMSIQVWVTGREVTVERVLSVESLSHPEHAD